MKLTEFVETWAYHIDDYLLEVETIKRNQEIVERLKINIEIYKTDDPIDMRTKQLLKKILNND